MSAKPIVEILYPEFGNQSGDNGNAVYLKACLPDCEIVETTYPNEPAFVTRDVSFVMLNSLTERHQELAVEALRPYRDRLAELADAGVPMLFTHSAAELLGRSFGTPDGRTIEGLGLFDFTTRLDMPTRYLCAVLGDFNPGDGAPATRIVGFKIQFTQVQGDNSGCAFCSVERGFGINETSKLEGFRRNNLIATWLIGPLLPCNPALTRWLLAKIYGEGGHEIAFADVVDEGYELRLKEFTKPLPPGVELSC